MKLQGGKLRSTRQLSSAEKAAGRPIRNTSGQGEREPGYSVRRIASKHAHRGRGSNPFAP
jgi:hypothetical protein